MNGQVQDERDGHDDGQDGHKGDDHDIAGFTQFGVKYQCFLRRLLRYFGIRETNLLQELR